jgi:hypothetical protein
MGFARTIGNLTVFFLKSQIPGGSPGGMIAVGIDSYITQERTYLDLGLLKKVGKNSNVHGD